MWTLLGIAVVVAGFAFRFNPLIVIAVAAGVTGWAGHMGPVEILGAFGKAFNDARYITIVFVALPAIGLMERAGLQERARILIARLKGVTTGRLLLVYLLYRQITAAVGLMSVGGQAQMVRPLVAPMAESAAEAEGPIDDAVRYKVRALAAATDNIGVFFAEDIFIALAPVLLIKATLEQAHVVASPFAISRWAIPTAILALIVHGARIWWFDRSLKRKTA